VETVNHTRSIDERREGKAMARQEDKRMSERQLYLFEDFRLDDMESGVDGDGLGVGEEVYEGEREELFLQERLLYPWKTA
jgi:hypothetical protein